MSTRRSFAPGGRGAGGGATSICHTEPATPDQSVEINLVHIAAAQEIAEALGLSVAADPRE